MGCGGLVGIPRNGAMEMCCWKGSYFHYWIDYNVVAFSELTPFTRMGLHIFWILVVHVRTFCPVNVVCV